MKELKLFTLAELQENEFDDKTIHDVLNKNVFKLSCIYEMFKYTKSKLSFDKVKELIKNDNWMTRKTWNWEEHDKFIIELAKAYKNVFQYSKEKSIRMAQDFVFLYGFNVKDTKQNEEKHFKNLLEMSF
jgi:hypothetical protein